MMDTIYTIAWIVFIAFFTTMTIISHIVDRRERKEILKQQEEYSKIFSGYFREKQAEQGRDLTSLSNAIEAYPNNDTRKIEIEKYKPVCPRGYEDCIWDPARIQYINPEWYKRLYGDMTPEEAVNAPFGCRDKVADDPDEKYYCYDDEEK